MRIWRSFRDNFSNAIICAVHANFYVINTLAPTYQRLFTLGNQEGVRMIKRETQRCATWFLVWRCAAVLTKDIALFVVGRGDGARIRC